MNSPTLKPRFHLQELISQDALTTLHQDVQQGLIQRPRSLPPKYFYDDVGSQLFEAICKTQDYYPTRTELALLEKYASEIIAIVKPCVCVELGAGTSTKTEVLLSEIHANFDTHEFNYISIDICKEVLEESAQRLINNYEKIFIQSIVGEYIPAIQALPNFKDPALFTFIGSSIGNFTEHESIQLLSSVAEKMSAEDFFLIGMDRDKDKKVLERAYDDSEDVTAKFNLNVLKVLNNKLDTDFDLSNFSHQAIYNENEQQIEMYLVSKCDHLVNFPSFDKTIEFNKGEKILTEISRKYTRKSIRRLLDKSCLLEVMHFEPENEYFSLVLARRKH